MPLWRIYAHPATFTKEKKAGPAAAITKPNVDPPTSLPAFYVNILFVPFQDEIRIGGETRNNFVRITTEQIGRTMDSTATKEGRRRMKWSTDNISDGPKRWIADRPELTWEHHSTGTPRDLQRFDRLDAPPKLNRAEAMWTRENKHLPWEKL